MKKKMEEKAEDGKAASKAVKDEDTKLLNKYESLSRQAEMLDTYEAYKELINTLKELSYEEMYNIMWDAETALRVLCRKENKANISGLVSLTTDIVKLGMKFLQDNDCPIPIEVKTIKPEKPYIGYTHEYIEEKRRKKTDFDHEDLQEEIEVSE